MSQGVLPMSQAGLSMSQGGLPMSQGALTMSQGGLPMSQSLSVSQANSLPLSQLGQYLSQNGSMVSKNERKKRWKKNVNVSWFKTLMQMGEGGMIFSGDILDYINILQINFQL